MMRRTFYLVVFIGLLIIITACSSSSKQTSPPQITPSLAPGLNPTISPGSPTSSQLIDTALQNGAINAETALSYKVFAVFKDPRLPAQYQGSAGINEDSHILDEVKAQFSSLSPATRQELLPFLMPPSYKGSWADPNLSQIPPEQQAENASRYEKYGLPCNEIDMEGWEYKQAMHSPVRVWWAKARPDDGQVADAMITAMDDDIWPKETSLMGHTPKLDGGTPCDGGSPDLDIYISSLLSYNGLTVSAINNCQDTPVFILIKPDVKPGTLAHEFMHAIQFQYSLAVACQDYRWLKEATATWVRDYIYPSDNYEQGYVESFYDPSQEPTLTLYEADGTHQYGAYVYFFYLTHHLNQPQLIGTIWNNTPSMSSIDAVDRGVPGGIEDTWGDFAIENVIETPRDKYKQWDGLEQKPVGKSLEKVEAAPDTTYQQVNSKILPLSIKYYWYTFTEKDRLVTFYNGLSYKMSSEPMTKDMLGGVPINDGTEKYTFSKAEGVDGLKIQAYYKIEGNSDWQVEDWTDKETMSFCRDASDERLTDLVLVFSNSSKDQDIQTQGDYYNSLAVSDIGCWRYTGNASLEMTGEGQGGVFKDIQTLTDVEFERTDTYPNIPYPFLRFQVVSGQLDRIYEYAGEKCSGDGENSSALGARNKYELYILYGALPNGPSFKRYGGTSNADLSVTISFECDDATPPPVSYPSFPWFFTDVLSVAMEKTYKLSSDGILDGSDNMLEDTTNAQMNYKWHLEPITDQGGPSAPDSGSSGPDTSGLINHSGLTNPAGGNAPTPVPSPTPGLPGVPIYPNIESSQQNSYGMLTLITTDSKDKVAEYYRAEFTKLGWTDGSMPYKPSTPVIQLNFTKQPQVVMVMITTQDNKTTIMITKIGG